MSDKPTATKQEAAMTTFEQWLEGRMKEIGWSVEMLSDTERSNMRLAWQAGRQILKNESALSEKAQTNAPQEPAIKDGVAPAAPHSSPASLPSAEVCKVCGGTSLSQCALEAGWTCKHGTPSSAARNDEPRIHEDVLEIDDEGRVHDLTQERAIAQHIKSQFPAKLPPDDYQFEFSFSVKLDYRDWLAVLSSLRSANAGAIGEVVGHKEMGLALVQWSDNGLRPIGTKVFSVTDRSNHG